MLYKINIVSICDNIYYDSENNWIYFYNEINSTMGFNVLNPYNYNTDSYNVFNTVIIERLKLYIDFKRNGFERYIKNCIKNKNFYFCKYASIDFIIKESDLNLNDFKIVY